MSYVHLPQLYKDPSMLLFRECYALEKVHGTSAHITWKDNQLHLSPGAASIHAFRMCFDTEALQNKISSLGLPEVTIYGEAYGGKMQGMSHHYGEQMRFIVFDVRYGEQQWLTVPEMDKVATFLGLEVVPWQKIPATLEAFDAARDAPSEVSVRRGITTPCEREGIVLRPLIEVINNIGERVIAKHRIEKYSERATPQKVLSAETLKVLSDARAIADEWVVPMRLVHILDKVQPEGLKDTPKVIAAMVEDVYREAAGEIVESKEVQIAIGRKTVELFKLHLEK